MSDKDFEAFASLIRAQTGIVITTAKRSMLVSRLSRRLRATGIRDFASYRKTLEAPGNEAERRELISVITTNVTSFFREPVHFEVLKGLVPSMRKAVQSGRRVRIWSAGCSSGEEPYSIAMTLKSEWPDFARSDVRLLATDIDPGMVAHARAGQYSTQQVGDAPSPILRQNLSPVAGTDRFAIDPSLKANLHFEELNLLGGWPFQGMFDVIFCRNVVIYFDAETRQTLWRRFAERLHPGGTLFIGHSERVDADLERYLEPCGVTQYRRTTVPVAVQRAGPAPAMPVRTTAAQP